jgi:hypothetical protein
VTKPAISVFLDTSTLKYAVDELMRLVKVANTISWPNGETIDWPIYEVRTIYPNEKLTGNREGLRQETYNLPFIAQLARAGHIHLLCHLEVLLELGGLPKTSDPRGRFYGAPIEMVNSPFQYGRVLGRSSWLGLPTDGNYEHLKPWKRRAVEFFGRVGDHRFKELQIACGAYQGSKVAPNQLLDAFHVYCAEKAGADFFLTCERVLVDQVRGHKRYPPKVAVVRPSDLLRELLMRKPFVVVGHALWFWMRQRVPRKNSARGAA